MNRDLYDEVMFNVDKVDKYPLIMHGVAGMLSRPEAAWLHRIPFVLGDGLYVDLGTFRGRSACIMADTIKQEGIEGKVITVDMFDDRAISRRFRGDGSVETQPPQKKDHFNTVASTFVDKGLWDHIKMVKSTTASSTVASRYPGCNMVFIDADHSYEGVKSDFLVWNSCVFPGGIIAFHDSHRREVEQFHSEIEDWEEIDRIDTLSVWGRK